MKTVVPFILLTAAALGARGASFNTTPTADAFVSTFNGATNGLFTYALALTPGLTADGLAGDNLSLRLFAADSTVSGVFNSRSFGTVANRPLLTIVAVPEPGPLALGALGLALLGRWRWAGGRK